MADRLIFEDDTSVIRDVSETYPLPVNIIEGGSDAYDPITGSDKVTVLNMPTYGAGIQEPFTNLNATFTRYMTVDFMGTVSAQFVKSGTDTLTYKIYASNQNDGTIDSSASYVDITERGAKCLTAADAASFTATCIHRIDCKGYKFLKFEITGGAGSNAGGLYTNHAY